MWLAAGIFFFSLGGIAGLFVLRAWEERKERVLAPSLRAKADAFALRIKDMLARLQGDIEKLPPEIVHLLRIVAHEVMLTAARTLRLLERKAHELADMVSHKHRFERRAPRSEFLHKVLEHKNENGTRAEVENAS